MSRALEKGVKDALKNGQHDEVYAKISAALTQEYLGFMEVELLGSAHGADPSVIVLQDDNAVAIPKVRLVQAFIHARGIFSRRDLGQASSKHDLGNATAVMLVTDPEHLTAANVRKKMLSSLGTTADAREYMAREKYFIDSLLTSRLHRHTKSPTLWNHRRWLMCQFRKAGLDLHVLRNLPVVVFVAADRHPRNYYAWDHARYLIDCDLEDNEEGREGTLATAIFITMKWCLSHHNDVSGWMFLYHLLKKAPRHTFVVLSETLPLAESFQWKNESVWYFLRNIFASPELPTAEFVPQFWSLLQSLKEKTASGNDGRVLECTEAWMKARGLGFKDPKDEDISEE